MIIIYLVFEKLNKEFENIIKYYFRNFRFKILFLNKLDNTNKKDIILFKKHYFPFINFENNLNKIINDKNISYLSSDNNIIYIPKDNWSFENNSFEIKGNKIDNNSIFDNTEIHNIKLHETYKKISNEYNVLYNIYYNKNNDFSYQHIYNKNISLKAVQDLLSVEEIKDPFYFVVLFIDKNNIDLLNEIENIKYKNCRFLVVLKNIEYSSDLDIIINTKLRLLSKSKAIYFLKNINYIHTFILSKGLVFEQLVFIKDNFKIDLDNLINSNDNKLIFHEKNLINSNDNKLFCPMNKFVTCTFLSSNKYKIKNVDMFFRYLNWHLMDINSPLFNADLKINQKCKIPQKYKILEDTLLEIKDYEGLLEIINNEIEKNMDKNRENELFVKKITIAILTEKEDILDKHLVRNLSNFEDVELLETLGMLIEKTQFEDVKKELWYKMLVKQSEKYDFSEKYNKKLIASIYKTLSYNQTDVNIIGICDILLKYDELIEIIKENNNIKEPILFKLLSVVINHISNEQVIENASKVFNILYDIENITSFDNLIKFSKMNKTYSMIFMNFMISNAIKFSSYYNSYDEFIKSRERIKNNLINIIDVVKDLNINISLDQLSLFRIGNFELSYQGLPSVDIFVLKNKLLRMICPSLTYNIDFNNNKNNKIKVLFHADMLNRYHSVHKDRHQVIKGLSEDDRFDIYFSTFDKLNTKVKYSYGKAKHIILPKNLEKIKNILSEYKFDIIVYCEIGMSQLSYYMAYLRLARIQCNTWGHSDTSGIDTIDYYFSSKLYELPYEESQTHYSEKLILQNSLCTAYVNPTSSYNKSLFKSKEHFGITQDTVAIFCAQSLFKLNPIYDDYIINILKNIDNSVLILLDNQNKAKVIERFNNYKIGSKLRFFPPSDHYIYMNLMNICDFVLDVYPFGGCNSSFEAFSLGKVIVTQPSIMINGRFTSGFYKKMGLEKLICNSKEEYINFAIKLGNDSEYRTSLENEIKDNNKVLFLDQETIQEWKDDLIKIYDDYHSKNI